MMEGGHRLIDHIVNVLFANESRLLEKIAEELLDKNQEKHMQRLDGFTHAGFAFNRPGMRGALVRKPLHISMWDEGNSYLRDLDRIEQDKTEIKMLLFKLLEHAFLPQHLRDAIPDCIADCLPDNIRELQRCGNPESGFNHPRDFRQYEKIMPKLEMYSAARLLY